MPYSLRRFAAPPTISARSALSAVGALTMGAGVFASYFMTLNRIENDHSVIIARARQVLFGEWPVRDFIDPGMPLTYLLSAAAAALGGPTLLSEAVLCVGLLALTAAITFWLTDRTTGTFVLAAAAASATSVFSTRLYSATKVSCLVIALWLGSRYARHLTLGRLAALGAWTGVAFLIRFDYAMYIGVGSVALIAMSRDTVRSAVAAGVVYAVAAGVVVLPWLVYVHATAGLDEYVGSAIRFAEAERSRTAAELPWFDWPLAQSANIDPALFYLFVSVPCVAFALAARMGRSPERTELAFFAVLTLLSDLAFLRDAVVDRLGDAIAPTAILAAYVARRVLPRQIVIPLAIGATGTLVTMGWATFAEQSPNAVANPGQQWSRVADSLRRNKPELLASGHLLELALFIDRCTPDGERVLVSGFAPEIPVVARRPFAGGLPAWLLGYYVLEPDVRIVQRHLTRERVGAVVLLEGSDVFVRSWPEAARWLRESGLQEHQVSPDVPNLLVWLRPEAAGRVDGTTGLPCRGD